MSNDYLKNYYNSFSNDPNSEDDINFSNGLRMLSCGLFDDSVRCFEKVKSWEKNYARAQYNLFSLRANNINERFDIDKAYLHLNQAYNCGHEVATLWFENLLTINTGTNGYMIFPNVIFPLRFKSANIGYLDIPGALEPITAIIMCRYFYVMTDKYNCLDDYYEYIKEWTLYLKQNWREISSFNDIYFALTGPGGERPDNEGMVAQFSLALYVHCMKIFELTGSFDIAIRHVDAVVKYIGTKLNKI